LSVALFAVIFIEKGKVAKMVDDAEKKLLADVGYRIRETRTAQGLSLVLIVTEN
jgi:ribosome-binding protein aMBF1 (putative translation factor)